MHPDLAEKRQALVALCRRFGVERLAVFGSVARGDDFNPRPSDADFLASFLPAQRNDPSRLADFKDALEALLDRPVDLAERQAIESSRNYIRRRRILAEAKAADRRRQTRVHPSIAQKLLPDGRRSPNHCPTVRSPVKCRTNWGLRHSSKGG